MSKPEHVSVVFKLEADEEGYPPAGSESLWVLPTPNGRFEIDNIPWFACEVSVGDVIAAKQDDDGVLWFESVVTPGGHSTVRIVLDDDSDEAVRTLRRELDAVGCESEWAGEPYNGLIAVDVPPDCDYGELTSLLHTGLESGRFDYEEANLSSGHAKRLAG